MNAPKIRVANGRIQIDEPTDFVVATGTAYSVRDFVELSFGHAGLDWREHVRFDEHADQLDDEERAELHQAIREGFDDAKAGRTIPAEQWLTELRSRL